VVGGALVGAAASALFEQELKKWLTGPPSPAGAGGAPHGPMTGRDVHGPQVEHTPIILRRA
jgi:hypothetical protein